MTDLDARLASIEAKLDLLTSTVLTRLLDAVVPTAEQMAVRANGTPGAHEEPEPDDGSFDLAAVSDWTDPFIGLDAPRPVNQVARLEAGEGVPGLRIPDSVATDVPAGNGARTVGETDAIARWRAMGEGSFDEWNRETHIDAPPGGTIEGVVGVERAAAAWVEPLEVD